ALGVAARVGGGPLRVDQPLPLVDAKRLGMDAHQLRRHRDDEDGPVTWALRPLCHRLPSPLAQSTPRCALGEESDREANSRSSSRSLRESFSGTATCMVTSRSPPARRPAPGTPRPRTRKVRPFWVPAGTLRVTGASRVGPLPA